MELRANSRVIPNESAQPMMRLLCFACLGEKDAD
jgi:hypothetical protein